MTPPKNTKQVRVFIVVINYYMDMWSRRPHLLHPLTALTSPKVNFKWTNVEQKAFNEINCTFAQDTILAYPYFNKPFQIHTDASNHQLGVVIRQEGKPTAFHSRKLTETQKRFTVTEKEFLSIVKTLKGFCTVLLGQQFKIYTDHKI